MEGARLTAGVAGAAAGGAIGGRVGPSLCRLFLGIATRGAGALTCGVIGGAAGGYSGGKVIGGFGADFGDALYVGDDLWI